MSLDAHLLIITVLERLTQRGCSWMLKARDFKTAYPSLTWPAIYAELFSDGVSPARACVEVAALPKGARVEIDCIALAV